jgi:hypothetical protein
MTDIKSWSATAASNNDSPPDGWPEGMNPSDVNNAAREMMAAIRTQHEDSAWIDLGQTPTFISTVSFSLVGDVAAAYGTGRRIRITDASTLYGEIVSAVFTSLTTVTVVLDSGVVSGSVTAVAVGILDENSKPLTRAAVDIVDLIYPVGAIFCSTVATNPNTLFGRGTWVATGVGRVLIGVGTSDEAFALDDTGGVSEHILLEAEMPSHNHGGGDHTHTLSSDEDNNNPGTRNSSNTRVGAATVTTAASGTINDTEGADTAHENLPPYLVVHMWERTVL